MAADGGVADGEGLLTLGHLAALVEADELAPGPRLHPTHG